MKKGQIEVNSTLQTTIVFSRAVDAINRSVRKFFLQGSSRSGKTYNFTIFYCWYCYNNANTKCIVVRSTLPRLKRTAYKDFKDVMINRLGIWEKSRMNQQDMEYTMDNGSTISFFATEDSQVAQGLKSDILFVNEATEVPHGVYLQLCLRNTHFICIDYNPNFSDDHWIQKEIDNPVNKGKLEVFITTYKDNPFLPKEQVEEIESLKYTNEALWRIYGLGERALVEGLVYPTFYRADTFPDPKSIHFIRHTSGIGIDYGYVDPFAVVHCETYEYYQQVEGKRILTKDLYVSEIAYDSYLSDDQQFAILTQPAIRQYHMFCDPSVPQFIEKGKKLHQLRIQGAIRNSKASKNSITPGISAIQSYRFFVVGDSPNLEKELRNYCYRQDREGNYTSQPIDQFNHLLDATRYYVYTNAQSGRTRRRGIMQR